MKKYATIVSVLLAATMLVSACTPTNNAAPAATPAAPAATPANEPAAPADEPGEWLPNNGNAATIRMSWWGADPRHEALIAALDLYMDRYPHITVDHEFGAFQGWMDNMVIQLAGQVEPDIMQVNYAWVHAFGGGTNVFLDLNTVSNVLDLSEWSPELLNFMTTADGQLGAVPHGVTGRVVIYDREMLAEHDLSSFPATFDEWIELGSSVSVGNAGLDQGNNTYAFYPLGPETIDVMFLQMLYNNTGKNMEENGQMLHTVEEVREIFEIIGRMTESGAMPTFEQQEPPHDATNPVWMEGRGGSAFEWVGNIFLAGGNFMENDLDRLGIANLPAVAPGGGQAIMQRPSLGHAISRNSDYPEVAAHLLNFLYTDEEALLIIAHHLGVPFSRTAAAIAERDEIIQGLQLEGVDLLINNHGIMSPLFEDPNLRQPRFSIFEAFRTGSIDAETAAERFLSEQQSALDNMR